MSDVVAVALISSSFPAAVAVVAAVASIFGPSWRDSRQRRAESEKASEDLRYQTALDFVDALTEASGFVKSSPEGRFTQRARAKFVATLRQGEGTVEEFTEAMRTADLDTVNLASDLLFRWLRGDLATRDLRFPAPLDNGDTD